MPSRPNLDALRSLLTLAKQGSTDAAAFVDAQEAGRRDGQSAADRLVEIIAANPLAADGHDAALEQALAYFTAQAADRRAAGEAESDSFAYYLTATVAVVKVLNRCEALASAATESPSSH